MQTGSSGLPGRRLRFPGSLSIKMCHQPWAYVYIVINIFVPGKPELLGTHEFSGVRFGLVARIVQDLHIVRHLSSATHAHSKILTKWNIVGKVLKKFSLSPGKSTGLAHGQLPRDPLRQLARTGATTWRGWAECGFYNIFCPPCVLKASKVLVRNLLAQEKTYLRVQIPLRQRSKEENLWLVGSWRPWSHRRDPEAGWVKLVKDFESRPARLDPWVGTQSLCLGCFAWTNQDQQRNT